MIKMKVSESVVLEGYTADPTSKKPGCWIDYSNKKARMRTTSYNTAYMLRAYALALRDIAPLGRNVVYSGTVK